MPAFGGVLVRKWLRSGLVASRLGPVWDQRGLSDFTGTARILAAVSAQTASDNRGYMPAPSEPVVQVGILTKGRPMLATVIANLVLQEERSLEIFVGDTGDQPAIKRDDVIAALRLAQDRKVRCEYELHRDKQRAFSSGRLKLLQNLTGSLLAFMDDDVVLPGTAMAALAHRAEELGPNLGWVAPHCVNAGSSRGFLRDRPHYSPGGIFFQDEVVRNILLE